MVKITYEPFKEVVIREYVRFERIEDLVNVCAQPGAGGAPVVLNWANGLVFAYTLLFPETDNLTEEFLKGRTYWINVSFAEMPEYKRIFETREKIQVSIINLSSSPVIRQVTERLKQQK